LAILDFKMPAPRTLTIGGDALPAVQVTKLAGLVSVVSFVVVNSDGANNPWWPVGSICYFFSSQFILRMKT